MAKLTELRVEDDDLPCPCVGPWTKDKYRLIFSYDQMFSSSMKGKWKRVYVDLYAGAGYSRIEGTSTVLMGSPILALSVSNPFDKYIFCEEDPVLLGALKQRVERIAPHADVSFIEGNCHTEIESICSSIPRTSANSPVLSLCFVDPFDFGIKFEALRRLSSFRVDFLVLLATGMDANRNQDHYVDGANPKIDEALGGRGWRERWEQAHALGREFMPFLAEEFALSMQSLGYLHVPLHQMKHVKQKNHPLYYLALFSKHKVAYKLWDGGLKYSTDQTSFGFGE